MMNRTINIVSTLIVAALLVGCNDRTNNIDVSKKEENPFEQLEESNNEDILVVRDEQLEETIINNETDAPIEVFEEQNDTVSYGEETNMNDFYIEEISDDVFGRMYGKSYKEDCTLDRSELRYLHVLYVGFDGNSHEGEIVCNKAIADDLIDIFRELYNSGYEIEKIRLVDEYDADDERSMSDNNSSCFNFRFISYTTTVSKHGKGMAIDINPLYNPYVKTVEDKLSVEPANAVEYVDRNNDFEHKIDENDLAYKLFIEHGFSWGGAWKSSKDYQHFEK